MGGQRSCFQIFLAFILKFLNYLQTFIGISMIVYSIFMLNHWNHQSHHVPSDPPSLAPSPFHYSPNSDSVSLHEGIDLDAASVFAGDVTQLGPVLAGQVNYYHLPVPW